MTDLVMGKINALTPVQIPTSMGLFSPYEKLFILDLDKAGFYGTGVYLIRAGTKKEAIARFILAAPFCSSKYLEDRKDKIRVRALEEFELDENGLSEVSFYME